MEKEAKGYQFQAIERRVKAQWSKGKIFQKLVEKNKNGARFRFLDGPITANNAMGIHHAFGRTLKDITIRYNGMKGRSCQYQNGFDAQGLWVEVEVEKELGFKGKQDIIAYGMDNFTTACINRVEKYAKVIEAQSKDLGQWMDWENSYFTHTDENILGIWHFLKKCDERGWIVKKHRVMSWCPRCGTSLSEHEMSGSYNTITCKSVFFKMPLDNFDADLLVWTTTPWTLTSNGAVALNPDLNYAFVKLKSSDRLVICCETAVKRVIKGDLDQLIRIVKGSDLVGASYKTLFPEFEVQNFTHKVIPWDDVLADEGTGLVHIAPGCGAEDFELGERYGIPAICPINEAGIIVDGFGDFSGQTTVEVADAIFRVLQQRNNLYYILDYEHKYAHCWRCKTDIVFKLVDEWYIRCDEIRPLLLEAVETVEWQPEHTKKRMIDWLNNMSDWNISRKRFYGLPLPFYECQTCGKTHVIGSKEELIERSSKEAVDSMPNFHRPWIDDIHITCDCGASLSRVTEVGDCWLDAGITPFVTKGYFTDREAFKENFPNDVVIEMVEQIRLWFYSMLFMSVTLEGKAPYKKVVAYGSVIREDGSKFSKSAGKDKNILLDDAINQLGADTIRYLYAKTTSVNDLRFGYSLGDDVKKRLLAFFNTYTFFDTYAQIDKPHIHSEIKDEALLTDSDRWVLQLVNCFIEDADCNYSKHVYLPILRNFEQLIDDINNWYIRINRKRFWKGNEQEKEVAYNVLYHVIKSICQVMAPIIPFMTEYIWHTMVMIFEDNTPQSVHLSDFPSSIDKKDSHIISQVNQAREIISIVQKMRNDKGIMTKQPLSKLYFVSSEEYKSTIETFAEEIKAETNIKELIITDTIADFTKPKISVNFKKAGTVLKQNVNQLKTYLDTLSEGELQQIVQLLRLNKAVKLDPFDVMLEEDLFKVDYVAKENYVIEITNQLTVVMDIHINDVLHKEYILRRLMRKLQVLRKDSGFKIDSHIRLSIEFSDEYLKDIVLKELETIKAELLCDDIIITTLTRAYHEIQLEQHSLKVVLLEQENV